MCHCGAPRSLARSTCRANVRGSSERVQGANGVGIEFIMGVGRAQPSLRCWPDCASRLPSALGRGVTEASA